MGIKATFTKRGAKVWGDLMSTPTMRKVGEELIKDIVTRTRDQHLDANYRRFAPYSVAYARRKGVDPAAVDLTRTGQMLDDLLLIEVTPTRLKIGFAQDASEQKAIWAHDGAGARRPPRVFMKMSRGRVDRVMQRLREALRRR